MIRALISILIISTMACGQSFASFSRDEVLRSEDRAIVDEYLKANKDINQLDHDGITLLSRAAFDGKTALVEYILSLGADPLVSGGSGYTSFHFSSFNEKSIGALIQLLNNLKDNISSISSNKGLTPLHIAAKSGNTEAIKLLIKHGSDVNSVTHTGDTPLIYAMTSLNPYYAALPLIKSGANVNAKNKGGYTALHIASAITAHTLSVQLLVENGADINAVTDDGQTPLMIAKKKGHLATPKYLDAMGAK